MNDSVKGFITNWITINFQRWMLDNVRGYKGGFEHNGRNFFTELEHIVGGLDVTEDSTTLEYLKTNKLRGDGALEGKETIRVKSVNIELMGETYTLLVSNHRPREFVIITPGGESGGTGGTDTGTGTVASKITRPTITYPPAGTIMACDPIEVTTGPYQAKGSLTHVSTDWQVSLTNDFSTVFLESAGDRSNLVTWPADLINDGRTYFVRARHNSVDESSSWSAPREFKLIDIFFETPSILDTEVVVDDGITFRVNVTGSAMSIVEGTAGHGSSDWKILDNGGVVVVENLDDKVNLTEWTVGGLLHDTAYSVQVRHRCDSGVFGDWSEPYEFTTPAVTVNAPTILSPEDGAVELPHLLTIETSEFGLNVGTAPHVSTDWQVSRTEDFDRIVRESSEDTTELTSWSVKLWRDGESYYVRARHNSTFGSSDWSTPIKIETKLVHPSVALYYGGLGENSNLNIVSRLDRDGVELGPETSVATAIARLAGAGIDDVLITYAGEAASSRNTVTRINSAGDMVDGQTNVGTSRSHLSGTAIDETAVFYAGDFGNRITRIGYSGEMIGTETTAGTGRSNPGGATIEDLALFYSGSPSSGNYTNTIVRINDSGGMVGSQTTAGTGRRAPDGAGFKTVGVYYGGYLGSNSASSDRITLINVDGAIVGTETTVGSARDHLSAAGLGTLGIWHGGSNASTGVANKITRLDPTGAMVGTESEVGTPRWSHAGGGLY